ncbi:MAG: hypothetical protein K0R10_1839 [Alphaproteobacteria bacterium]|jgi:hypothetical protein|nr:hypothetical protein [Alphaproteobacteria bacterium]
MMADKNFFKDNFVLIIGLALPVLLMVGFMVVASLPQKMGDPPKYDLIFSTSDYNYSPEKGRPVNVSLVVKDGVLKAQYTKVPDTKNPNYNWIKLYQFDAKTQTVRLLEFGDPYEMDKIDPSREDTVEATKGLKLDTTLKSPDGFELTAENYRRYGLVNEIFGSWRNDYNMKLRSGMTAVPLKTGNPNEVFYNGQTNFIGWVTGTN